MMRKSLIILLIVASLCALTTALHESESSTSHVIETPKGKVIISINKDGSATPGAEASAAEDSAATTTTTTKKEEVKPEAAAEESSSPSESSGSAGESESSTPSLTNLHLPPEPSVAKGYKSPECGDNNPCEQQENDSMSVGSSDSDDNGEACTENCEAEGKVSTEQVVRNEFMTQPVGTLDTSSGLHPVAHTQAYSNDKVGSGNDLVTVPQTGVPSTPSSAAPIGGSSSAAASGPGSSYQSPELVMAKRLADLNKKEQAERESTRENLHKELDQHVDLLNKVNDMARALKFQYAELRRHHNAIRTAISANKAALNTLGGDNMYQGTDYDIEAPLKDESISDIEDIIAPDVDVNGRKVHPWETELHERVKQVQQNEMKLQERDQSAQRNVLRQFFGDKKMPVQKGDKPSKVVKNKHIAHIKNLIENMKQVSKPLVGGSHLRKLSEQANDITESLKDAEKALKF